MLPLPRGREELASFRLPPCGVSRASPLDLWRLTGLLVEPEVLEALAVVDAVDLGNEVLDLRVVAIGDARVEEDRSRVVVGYFLFDRPHHLLALRDIAHRRL